MRVNKVEEETPQQPVTIKLQHILQMVEHIAKTKLLDEELQEDQGVGNDQMHTFNHQVVPAYE